MKTKEIAKQYGIDQSGFETYLRKIGAGYDGLMSYILDDDDVPGYVGRYKAYLADIEDGKRRKKEAEDAKQKALASMLISSGFNFEGYKIVKYSGYISGDDVTQIAKEKGIWGQNKTDVGNALSKALVDIRRQAIKELKEAAYELGCNAVIGVDFDYITLDPEVHNGQYTQDLPYVFCVTANGNAVVIEKE